MDVAEEQNGTTGADATGSTTGAADTAADTISRAEFAKVVEDRDKLKKTLRDLAPLADAGKKALDAAKTTEERLAAVTAERDGERGRVKAIAVNAELRVQAIKAGLDPDLAVKLADAGSVTYDDATGAATGADEVIKALVTKYPQLAGAGLPAGQTPDNTKPNKNEPQPASYAEQRRAAQNRLHGLKL